mmetsp:Transcript_55670/g.154068  ORF Transcript_55670/g.154068 Transcript_55670/m.154068 type:complete len:278 (-) Transcript_55670:186-1019(-)
MASLASPSCCSFWSCNSILAMLSLASCKLRSLACKRSSSREARPSAMRATWRWPDSSRCARPSWSAARCSAAVASPLPTACHPVAPAMAACCCASMVGASAAGRGGSACSQPPSQASGLPTQPCWVCCWLALIVPCCSAVAGEAWTACPQPPSHASGLPVQPCWVCCWLALIVPCCGGVSGEARTACARLKGSCNADIQDDPTSCSPAAVGPCKSGSSGNACRACPPKPAAARSRARSFSRSSTSRAGLTVCTKVPFCSSTQHPLGFAGRDPEMGFG